MCFLFFVFGPYFVLFYFFYLFVCFFPALSYFYFLLLYFLDVWLFFHEKARKEIDLWGWEGREELGEGITIRIYYMKISIFNKKRT